jgi:3-hydroxyisobutyrate dehydrogenase
VVISSLRDDPASAAVWAAALPGMAAGVVGIETSTISPTAARGLHKSAEAKGVAFLDAPVAGSRPQAEAGQLIFMAGGAPEVLARVEGVLMSMGGAVHLAGGPGAGAAVKLMVNSLFAAQLAAMAELLGLAQDAGIDLARAVGILTATPVASPALAGAAAAMLALRFAPSFPIELVVKDLGLALGAGGDLPMTRTVSEVYSGALREGLGDENITAVVQRYLRD